MARFSRLLTATALAALMLGGCNAVLGIDEAHPRESEGAVSREQIVPIGSCNGLKGNCASCVPSACATSLPSALATRDGREALDNYRACLGASCNNRACFDSLKGGPLHALAECLPGECDECLGTSPLADMCELYCACMQNDCDGIVGSSAPYTAGDPASCKAHCQQLDLASLHCRFTHCQLKHETPTHCSHAISDVRCPPAIEVGAECTTRRMDGWGCKDSSQCCNDSCSTNHICE